MYIDRRTMRLLCIIGAILTGCVLLFTVVCALTSESPGTQAGQEGQGSWTVSSSDGAQTGTTRLYREYSGTFTADAKVSPAVTGSVNVYRAAPMELDEQALTDAFFDGSAPARRENPRGTYTEYLGDDGSVLTVTFSQGSFNFRTKALEYIKFPTENFSTKYEFSYLHSGLPRYDTVYKLGELDFLSREDAVKAVTEVLTRLNIPVSDDVEVYAIDRVTMQEHQERLLQSPESSAQFYSIKDAFTKEDEFYILSFTAVQDALPITHRCYTAESGGKFVMGTNIKVYLSPSGITYLDASMLYRTQGVEETHDADALISAQDAIDKTFAIHSADSAAERVTVTEAHLEYGCVPNDAGSDEVRLVPVWSLTLRYDIGGGQEYLEMVSINALTGEEVK